MLIQRTDYNRSCINMLEGEWERRYSERHDDDGHSKGIGLRLLLLTAVVMAAKAPPPQNEHISDNERMTKVRGENTQSSASSEAGWIRSSMALSAY